MREVETISSFPLVRKVGEIVAGLMEGARCNTSVRMGKDERYVVSSILMIEDPCSKDGTGVKAV